MKGRKGLERVLDGVVECLEDNRCVCSRSRNHSNGGEVSSEKLHEGSLLQSLKSVTEKGSVLGSSREDASSIFC